MKKIKLTRGKYALVDDEDYEWLSKFKWCYQPNKTGYAVTRLPNIMGGGTIPMARMIMEAEDGVMVDHKNGDTLDNRKENLRLSTHHQNQMNQKKRSDNTSGYKGVSFHNLRGKWKVQVSVDKKVTYIGLFEEPRHAALCYDLWAKDLYGEFARTNFKSI